MESLSSNNTNTSCPLTMSWTESTINSQQPILTVCIVASIIHSIFWLQFLFCSSVRKKSMQWIYAFLITNILLLFRFLFLYIVYTKTTECQPTKSWVFFVSYFDATVDDYLNILEVYTLLALNICRYIQIAYNRNVYTTDRRRLIAIHFVVYLTPLFILLVQYLIGWTQIERFSYGLCDTLYTNAYIQIFNIIIGFALPIILNILVIYVSVRHVRLISTLQRAQHHVSAREKYNRSLVIQFLVFYTIWVALWSPDIIVDQLTNDKDDITRVVRLLNFSGITLNPIIVGALDVRFWKAWRKMWLHWKNKHVRGLQRQVRPAIVYPTLQRIEKQNEIAL